MSEQYDLDGAVRESFGKGAARKLRAAGQTPAVVYGHGTTRFTCRSTPTHSV